MRRRHLDDGEDSLIELPDGGDAGSCGEEACCEREVCEQQLMRLDRALLYSSAEDDDDWVYLPGGLEVQDDFRVAGVEQVQERRRAERIWGRTLGLAEQASRFAAAAVEAHIRWLGFCRRGEVRATMQALSARLEALAAAA